jgi:drug/metabolite transporter (DMT)-like permease
MLKNQAVFFISLSTTFLFMEGLNMSKKMAIFYLLVTAVLWSSAGILIKSVSWHPLAMVSARGLLAGLTLWFFLREQIVWKSLTIAHGVSGLSLTFLSCGFIGAMRFTTAANAIVLFFSAPIWVALLAPLIVKERTSLMDWTFVAIIIGGMILFFVDTLSPEGLFGNILAIISGFFFALQVVSLRKVSKSSPGLALVFGNFVAFIAFLPFWAPPWPDWTEIMCLFAMGVFQVGFSYYLYTIALPFVSSLELVMITMLEPVLTPIVTYFVLGEKPGRFALLGGFIVILGVIIWSVLKNRHNKNTNSKEKLPPNEAIA